MSMKRQSAVQGELVVAWSEMPRSPGRYFRMHMVGYFEGIDSERGLAWRCSDSLSLLSTAP